MLTSIRLRPKFALETRMKKKAAGVVILLLSLSITAQTVPTDPLRKPAWEWTLDERIARRLDPDAIRARAAAHRRAMGENDWTPADPVRFTIDGKRDPELLLPFELFNSILGGVDDDPIHRELIQRIYREKIRESGWDEEFFWPMLQKATAEYWRTTEKRLALERKTRYVPAAERNSLSAETETLGLTGCRLRAEAFQAVRQKLGAEKFDRFLYENVAPNVGIGSDFPAGNEAWRLRFIEGGCQ
jgi:hypothetical protein